MKNKGGSMLVIFYKDGSKQVTKPLLYGVNRFDGNWRALAHHIGGDDMLNFDIL